MGRVPGAVSVLAAAAALGTAVLGTLALATAAAAQPDTSITARLEGQFELTGQITAALHVRGEHPGQQVLRTWTFTPLCATRGCEQVEVLRQRQGGTDRVLLTLQAADYYVGRGRFFAPLRCGRRRNPKGESVPFTITVRITAATIAGGVAVATRLQATYDNPQRFNHTRCVTIPGHDAAIYDGTLAGSAPPT